MNRTGRNILLWTLAAVLGPVLLVLLGASLWWARMYLTPILVGFAFAYLLDPIVRAMERHGIKRPVGVLLLGLLFIMVLVALPLVIVPMAQKETQQLVQSFAEYYQVAEDWFTEVYTSYFSGEEIPPIIESARLKVTENLNVWLPQWLSNTTSAVVASVGAIVLGVLLATLATFYLLLDFVKVKGGLAKLVPKRWRPRVVDIAHEVDGVIGRYIRGQFTVVLSVAILATIALTVIGGFYGTQYALVCGLLMGITQLIPAIGITISCLVAGTVAYFTAEHHALTAVLVTVLTLLAINVIFDNLIAPRIVGRKVGLHPLVSLLAVLIGGAAFGFIGVLLAVPLVASVKVAIERFYKQEKEADEAKTGPEVALPDKEQASEN